MAIIAFPKETQTDEKRCALLPANVKSYTLLGVNVKIEAGLGERINISDQDYIDAGAKVVSERAELLAEADVILSIHKLPVTELPSIKKKSALLVSFLDPFFDPSYVMNIRDQGLSSLSVEMIPRISRCQKMDALSSQASLAGYVMTMLAANSLQSVLPMMMTPAGTLKPAKVFVIGAGVAGLQAIATAKRLGASVTAFDTRSVVAEQVQSLGAKFLDIDLGQTSETGQGYAQALTPEQMGIQQAAQAKCIAESDIVITTAQLFGRKPPLLIKQEVLAQMKPGSVVVDMAAESGGNVEGSIAGASQVVEGVTLIGLGNWSNSVAKDASQMYASNLFSLVAEFWQKDDAKFKLDPEDEILQSCLITHGGEIINQTILSVYNQEVA